MPRHNKIEKSKDLKGSSKKIFLSLKPWVTPIVIAIILSFISAYISLVAPNKLSTLTDYITDGLKPNVSEEVIKSIMIDPSISDNDKYALMSLQVDENILAKLDELPTPIYERIKPVMDMDAIKTTSLVLLIYFTVSALTSYIEQLILAKVTNNYGKSLRNDIISKTDKLPLRYFDNHENGDLLSRITNDVDTLSQNLNQGFSSLITLSVLFIGSIIMMFVNNFYMAITGILASLIGFMFMGVILSKSQKYFVERQERLGNLNGYIEEMYSAHNVITTYNAKEMVNKEFDKINNKLYKSSKYSQFLSGIMQPMMGFVGNLGYVSICIVGAILCIKGKISFGIIVAFMVYVRMFTSSLSQLAQIATAVQSTVAAGERVFEFLDEEEMSKEEVTDHLDVDKVKGSVEFNHVKFGYNPGKTIIKDFTASIKPGYKVAIVGPTGAGKTTLVNLLMKFYDIDSGSILIDGVDIKGLSRENIHELFCMVLQDTWLFDGTIKENIIFNRTGITDEEVWDKCKLVGIDHFIKTLPNGLDALVNENDTISSGQKQLLTIARGMIKETPFLILDEATSNVDTRTEELVQKAMDKLTKGKTSFIIAHRLSTIKNADLILVMKNGNIVEQGNHDELLKLNGFYAELYNSQFQN